MSLQKFVSLLEEIDQWERSSTVDGEYEVVIHKSHPEYTIKSISNDHDAHELYMFDFPNATPHWSNVEVYYNQTLIHSYVGVDLDGLKYGIVAPKRKIIEIFKDCHNEEIPLFYFVKGSIEFSLSKVLCHVYGTNFPLGIFELSRSVFIFDSLNIMDLFINYVNEHVNLYLDEKEKLNSIDCLINLGPPLSDEINETFEQQAKQVQALKKVFESFKSENDHRSNMII